jgi:hypothetical protein
MLTNADDIELEAPLDALLLNLLGDAVETDIAVRKDRLGLVGGGHCGWCGPRGRVYEVEEDAGGRVRRGSGQHLVVVQGKIQGRCNFLVELQLRERGQPRSGALVMREVRRDWRPDRGAIYSSIGESAPTTPHIPIHPSTCHPTAFCRPPSPWRSPAHCLRCGRRCCPPSMALCAQS